MCYQSLFFFFLLGCFSYCSHKLLKPFIRLPQCVWRLPHTILLGARPECRTAQFGSTTCRAAPVLSPLRGAMPSDLSPLCGMLPRPPKTLCPTSQPSLRAWSATQLASSHRCSKRGPAVHGVEGTVPHFFIDLIRFFRVWCWRSWSDGMEQRGLSEGGEDSDGGTLHQLVWSKLN